MCDCHPPCYELYYSAFPLISSRSVGRDTLYSPKNEQKEDGFIGIGGFFSGSVSFFPFFQFPVESISLPLYNIGGKHRALPADCSWKWTLIVVFAVNSIFQTIKDSNSSVGTHRNRLESLLALPPSVSPLPRDRDPVEESSRYEAAERSIFESHRIRPFHPW